MLCLNWWPHLNLPNSSYFLLSMFLIAFLKILDLEIGFQRFWGPTIDFYVISRQRVWGNCKYKQRCTRVSTFISQDPLTRHQPQRICFSSLAVMWWVGGNHLNISLVKECSILSFLQRFHWNINFFFWLDFYRHEFDTRGVGGETPEDEDIRPLPYH